MFGYQEEKYKVLKSKEISIKNMKNVIEVRKPLENESHIERLKKCNIDVSKITNSPYISLTVFNEMDKMVVDLLFYYTTDLPCEEDDKTEAEKQILLDEDFAMLISETKEVKYSELNAYERIENHHKGYTKSGAVTMY